MKKPVVFTFFVVAIISLIVWAVSKFIQPILPSKINNELFLYIGALSAVISGLANFTKIEDFFEQKIKRINISKSLRARSSFLDSIDNDSNADELEKKVNDLIAFVEKLPQGQYYAQKITEMTRRPIWSVAFVGEDPGASKEINESFNRQYRQKLLQAKPEIYSLINELAKRQ
jgi:hypothetical protein